MTEADISGYVAALLEAVNTDQQAVAAGAALTLLQGFLVDVNRIADAVEAIAHGLQKGVALTPLLGPPS